MLTQLVGRRYDELSPGSRLPRPHVTDRDSLLSGVLADPADDTIRLVLADLLRESEDAGDQRSALSLGRRHCRAVPTPRIHRRSALLCRARRNRSNCRRGRTVSLALSTRHHLAFRAEGGLAVGLHARPGHRAVRRDDRPVQPRDVGRAHHRLGRVGVNRSRHSLGLATGSSSFFRSAGAVVRNRPHQFRLADQRTVGCPAAASPAGWRGDSQLGLPDTIPNRGRSRMARGRGLSGSSGDGCRARTCIVAIGSGAP